MTVDKTQDPAYQRAVARAGALRAFYSSLAAFVVINIALFLLNLVTGGGWWFYWVTIFWGIGMLFWAFSLFVQKGRFGDTWEQRKADEIYEQEKREGGSA